MSKFKDFRIHRRDETSWDYLIEIDDENGQRLQLTATFDDLDRIAFEVERHVEELIAAAERKGASA